jgi:hypothetical protein
MKANARYLASEILTEAGFDTALIGQVMVRIGGLNVSSDKPIYISDTKSIDVYVGGADSDSKTIELTETAAETEDSEGIIALRKAEEVE